MEKINRVLHNWTTGPTIPSFTIFQSLLKFIRLATIFFSVRVFFHRHWRFTGQQEKEEDHLLFHSTTSTCSRTLRHLFATLHVRWLSRIFNRNICVYQNATRWALPPYQITIWLIDWLIDWWCNVCLFTWWINSRCLLQPFDMGNRWIWTRIDYECRVHTCHPHPVTDNDTIFTAMINVIQ